MYLVYDYMSLNKIYLKGRATVTAVLENGPLRIEKELCVTFLQECRSPVVKDSHLVQVQYCHWTH